MGFKETLRLVGEDPLHLVRSAKKRQLEALRTALAARMPAGIDVDQVVFDDSAESTFTPHDDASLRRRLYHNRIGLNLAARVESRTKWRLFAAAVAGLAGTIAIASIGGDTQSQLQVAVDRWIASGAGVLALLAGGWLGWHSLGFTPRGHAMLLPAEVLTQADIDDVDRFGKRVLVRDLPDGVPADLADQFRPLTIDAEGRAVDGQVIPADQVESYAVESVGGRLIILGGASWSLLMSGLGALNFASGSGFESAILGAGASGIAGAAVFFAGLRLFLLPEVAERRAIAGDEARKASPLAMLVQQDGEKAGQQPEGARAGQLEFAMRDSATFIKLGHSTGLLAQRRDPLAPSEGGMPFGLTASDLSMHMMVFGDTGRGKTASVIRPMVAGWTAKGCRDGLVVLDGKGSLPDELVGLRGFEIIHPDHCTFNPIENLTGDEVADAFYAMFAGKEAKDPHWDEATTKLIRTSAIILEHVTKSGDLPTLHYNLASLHRMIFSVDARNEARDVLLQNPAVSSYVMRSWEYLTVEFYQANENARASILGIASVWLSKLIDNAKLSAWAEAKTGVQIEDTLSGARIGVLLPDSEFGVAGAAIANFAKSRLYKRIKLRKGRDWRKSGETPVLLVIDECQALMTRDETTMLPIARSLGLHALFATQNVDGIFASLGGSSKSHEVEQLLGQFISTVSLSVKSEATKQFVSSRMGTVSRARYAQIPSALGDAAGCAAAMLSPATGHAAGTVVGDALAGSETARSLRRFTGFAGQASAMAKSALEKVGLSEALDGLLGNRQTASMTVGTTPLVLPEEVEALTVQKGYALVSVIRGGTTRRDLVKLQMLEAFEDAEDAEVIEESRPNAEEVRRDYA